MEEQSDVAGCDDFGGHADYEADDSHADWADDVPELLLASVGAPCNAQREDAREHPRRRTHEQSGNIAESESLGQSRL